MRKKARKAVRDPDLKSNKCADDLSNDYLVLSNRSWDYKSSDWVTYYYEKGPSNDVQKKH